jgi:hypothetical protein
MELLVQVSLSIAIICISIGCAAPPPVAYPWSVREQKLKRGVAEVAYAPDLKPDHAGSSPAAPN